MAESAKERKERKKREQAERQAAARKAKEAKKKLLNNATAENDVINAAAQAEQARNEHGLSLVSQSNLTDAEKKLIDNFKVSGDIETISTYIESIIKTYTDLYNDAKVSKENAAAEEKTAKKKSEEATKANNDAQTALTNAQSIENEAKQHRAEYAEKLREVSEKIKSGEFSKEVDNFLEMIVGGQLDLFGKAKKTIEEIKKNADSYTSKVVEETSLDEEDIDILAQRSTLKAREDKLNNRLKKVSLIEENEREEIRKLIREEFQEQLDEKEKVIAGLRLDVLNEQGKTERVRADLTAIQSAFSDRDPLEMLRKYNEQSTILSELESKCDNEHTTEEWEAAQQKIEYYENLNIERKRDEAKAELLKTEIDTMAPKVFSSKIAVLESQLETIRYTNKVLQENLETQKKCIETLANKKIEGDKAFECAHRYDQDNKTEFKEFDNGRNIKDLHELCVYVQRRLASLKKPEKPLYYKLEIIRLFLAGLNMSNITILQGISGTGKTSLAREFVRAITAGASCYCDQNDYGEENAPYRICAVQSGWRDNMDLMGFYNVFQNKYNETEIFKGLYLANTNLYKDTLYFIILDEMNLSHPEHYFADFLSLLEHPNLEQRKIVLKDVPEDNALNHLIGSKLQIMENIRFIGTANHDETTLSFAPKTLDRSNVIDIPNPKFSPKDIPVTDAKYTISYHWIKKQFEVAENDQYIKGLCQKFIDFITKNEIITLLFESQEILFGKRFEEQASKFISAYVATGDTSSKESMNESLAYAADHLITMRLLRKIKERRYDIDSYEDVEDFMGNKNANSSNDKYWGFINEFKDVFGSYPKDFAEELLNEEINWHKKQKN